MNETDVQNNWHTNASQNSTLHNSSSNNDINCIMSEIIWYQSFIYIFFIIVFIVTVIGNGLVCYTVYNNPHMRTVTNYFIVNLAIGDILIAFFAVPSSFVTIAIEFKWPYSPQLCPVISYLQIFFVMVSAYTLVAISIDRYIALLCPLKPKLNKRQAQFIIFAIWIIAFAVPLPTALVSKLSNEDTKCKPDVCREVWIPKNSGYIYSMVYLIFQYVIPVVFLIYSYTSIVVVLWGKRPPGEAENARDQRMARSKKRLVKMLLTTVIVYTICWLPFDILIFIMDSGMELGKWSAFPFIWIFCRSLATLHSCCNPIIYCWMSKNFRNGFISAIACLSGVHRICGSGRRTNNLQIAEIAPPGSDSSSHSVSRKASKSSVKL